MICYEIFNRPCYPDCYKVERSGTLPLISNQVFFRILDSPPKLIPKLCLSAFKMDLNLVSGSISLIILYFVSRTIYNLYLSPISNIPGPKLAAATGWYEFYHDIITYGKYVFTVYDMHKEYGPIVRISPYEVHISDPDFYDTLYASSNTNRKDRWSWYVIVGF
jgi:hypothetical protein